MWFTEYLFLERSWAKDEKTLKVRVTIIRTMYIPSTTASSFRLPSCVAQSGLERLKDFPRPFWLALFVEGTRFTQTKLLAAQEYAASQGLPIPRNVLIPRTKVRLQALCVWWICHEQSDVDDALLCPSGFCISCKQHALLCSGHIRRYSGRPRDLPAAHHAQAVEGPVFSGE